MRIRTAILAALAGAVVIYLFDPKKGASRRERLRSTVSRISRRPSSKADDETLPENLAPIASEPRDTYVPPVPTAEPIAAPRPGRPTEDVEAGALGAADGNDVGVAGQVRARLDERPDLGTDDLVIDVVNGVAYLSGDLHDPQTFGEVVDLTREVPGVRRVQSLLHLPPSETIPGATVTPSDDPDTG